MVVLAAVLRTLPYAMAVLWPAQRSIPPALLDAAAVDGLGPFGQALRVGLPMTRAAIATSTGQSFTLVRGASDALLSHLQQERQQALESSQATYTTATNVGTGVFVGALILIALLGWRLTRSIVRRKSAVSALCSRCDEPYSCTPLKKSSSPTRRRSMCSTHAPLG